MPLIRSEFIFKPIGYVECPQRYRYEAPRQGVFASNEGIIRLEPDLQLDTAVRDLAGFDRIWVIYCFHLNVNWRPLVRPPVGSANKRIGVLSTRSPHRPNPIGMSCVELTEIDGLIIKIKNFDMLDRTPVLDIKPYIPQADSFPDSQTGWLKPEIEEYKLNFSDLFVKKSEWIKERCNLDMINFSRTQLAIDPLNEERKRLKQCGENEYTIGCRTWKLHFFIKPEEKELELFDISSSYSLDDLAEGAQDKYQDKDIHKTFLKTF